MAINVCPNKSPQGLQSDYFSISVTKSSCDGAELIKKKIIRFLAVSILVDNEKKNYLTNMIW